MLHTDYTWTRIWSRLQQQATTRDLLLAWKNMKVEADPSAVTEKTADTGSRFDFGLIENERIRLKSHN